MIFEEFYSKLWKWKKKRFFVPLSKSNFFTLRIQKNSRHDTLRMNIVRMLTMMMMNTYNVRRRETWTNPMTTLRDYICVVKENYTKILMGKYCERRRRSFSFNNKFFPTSLSILAFLRTLRRKCAGEEVGVKNGGQWKIYFILRIYTQSKKEVRKRAEWRQKTFIN